MTKYRNKYKDREFSGRTPHGKYTTDVSEYTEAWRSLAEPLERYLGVVRQSFDPSLTVYNIRGKGDSTTSLPVWLCLRINRLIRALELGETISHMEDYSGVTIGQTCWEAQNFEGDVPCLVQLKVFNISKSDDGSHRVLWLGPDPAEATWAEHHPQVLWPRRENTAYCSKLLFDKPAALGHLLVLLKQREKELLDLLSGTPTGESKAPDLYALREIRDSIAATELDIAGKRCAAPSCTRAKVGPSTFCSWHADQPRTKQKTTRRYSGKTSPRPSVGRDTDRS